MAIFSKDGKKVKTTHFGASGYLDFLKTGDKARRSRYIKRHTNNRENHGDYKSAGALSRFILWGATTSLTSNINPRIIPRINPTENATILFILYCY